ncbi:MAG: hypothetical protein O3A21_08495 [Proteobacteria bacterium]|nr:hypothetical protein [Pseudomonadota bacterium]
MRMKSLSGFNFGASLADIPNGMTLAEVGPKAYAPGLARDSGGETRTVANHAIVLSDGTPAYQTEIHWTNNNWDFKTLAVSAFKNGKWIMVYAHPSKDQSEANEIVKSLSLRLN